MSFLCQQSTFVAPTFQSLLQKAQETFSRSSHIVACIGGRYCPMDIVMLVQFSAGQLQTSWQAFCTFWWYRMSMTSYFMVVEHSWTTCGVTTSSSTDFKMQASGSPFTNVVSLWWCLFTWDLKLANKECDLPPRTLNNWWTAKLRPPQTWDPWYGRFLSQMD